MQKIDATQIDGTISDELPNQMEDLIRFKIVKKNNVTMW